MYLVVMRHGTTPYNEQHRYAGVTDVPLSDVGRLEAHTAGTCTGMPVVYVSPLSRAQETAAICFPGARQVVVDGLAEMNFGAFEGRSADEMADDEAYRVWVDGMCEGKCPQGESRAEFEERVARALADILRDARDEGAGLVAVVGHGGTVMSTMDVFCRDGRDYFAWQVGNCQGYRARVEFSGDDIRLVDFERFADLGFLRDLGYDVSLEGSDDEDTGSQGPYEPHSFFQNRACKYFPCHEGVPLEDFNCLFCYCPLYALGPACGGNFTYTAKGVKNCVNCAAPHVGDNGVRLVKKHFGKLAELARP